MVKPIFQAINGMKAAPTADVAKKIVTDFLQSPYAQTVPRKDAGTFLKRVEEIFQGFKAPDHYEEVLDATVAMKTKASADLQELARYALIDFNAHGSKAAKELPLVLNNAKILAGFREPPSEGFKFATHYGPPQPEGLEPDYVVMRTAENAEELKLAINLVLSENDITDDRAELFMYEVNRAFKKLGKNVETPAAQKDLLNVQIELLSLIRDGSGIHVVLADMAEDQMTATIEQLEQIDKSPQKTAQSTAPNLGPKFD